MEPAISASHLRDTATVERVGEKASSRLSEVHALFGADMGFVEAELLRTAGKGLRPGTDAATHLLLAGGKRVRPLCVLLAAACFRGAELPEAARQLAVVAELVHLATLLHDDVIDDGDERRGKPTSRRLWGNAVSVLAGDLLLTHGLERTAQAAPGPALTELFQTLRALVDGEIVQLRGRTEVDVDEATYFAIVRDKTASLFRWASRSGARVAGATDDAVDALGEFGEHLGVAFQLVDDALDYAGDAVTTGKELHADLREGKLTLPLLRALAQRKELLPMLVSAREGDDVAAERLIQAVRATSGAEEARALARMETASALLALGRLPPSPARDLLGAVARELTARAF